MARRRSAPRGGFKSFPKRATLWLPFDTSVALTTAGTVVASGDLLGQYFGQTGEEVPIGTTIGPVRGTMRQRPTVTGTTDSTFFTEMAMQLLPEGGRATLPSPGTDIIDGMWYGQLMNIAVTQETGSGVFGADGIVAPFVTNAMRKVTGNGQELTVFAVPNTNVDHTVNFLGVLMLKLP